MRYLLHFTTVYFPSRAVIDAPLPTAKVGLERSILKNIDNL
jgi:hypothetical protein